MDIRSAGAVRAVENGAHERRRNLWAAPSRRPPAREVLSLSPSLPPSLLPPSLSPSPSPSTSKPVFVERGASRAPVGPSAPRQPSVPLAAHGRQSRQPLLVACWRLLKGRQSRQPSVP